MTQNCKHMRFVTREHHFPIFLKLGLDNSFYIGLSSIPRLSQWSFAFALVLEVILSHFQ